MKASDGGQITAQGATDIKLTAGNGLQTNCTNPGSTALGAHNTHVASATLNKMKLTGNGILIAEISGTSPANVFTLAAPLISGGFQYTPQKVGNNWYLQSSPYVALRRPQPGPCAHALAPGPAAHWRPARWRCGAGKAQAEKGLISPDLPHQQASLRAGFFARRRFVRIWIQYFAY